MFLTEYQTESSGFEVYLMFAALKLANHKTMLNEENSLAPSSRTTMHTKELQYK